MTNLKIFVEEKFGEDFEQIEIITPTRTTKNLNQSHDKVNFAKTYTSLLGEIVNGESYVLNEKYLEYRDIDFGLIDDCLKELRCSLITCQPLEQRRSELPSPDKLFRISRYFE